MVTHMSEEVTKKDKELLNVPSEERLTGIQVSRIVEDYDQSQYLKNEAYYQGKNLSLITQGIVNEQNGKNPNNVVPLPFARKTINDLQGYAYKPGNVNYVFDEEDEEGEEVELVRGVFKENEEPLVSAEIFQDAAIKGEGAELLYFANEKIQFTQIDREQCIFEYEDTVKEDKLKWSIRYYKFRETQRDGQDEIIHRADVYYKERVDFYKWREKEELSGINQQRDQARFDGDLSREYEYIGSELHPFGEVPLYPYRINSDRLGVFQPQIPIIDKLDELGSDSIANAIDQFNDTILLLSKSIQESDVDKIREWKVLDDLGGKEEGNFAEFLQRNLNIEATLESTKVFERWYYELTGIPNLNDEKFNVKSGIAIAYALTNFENLVTSMEIYFTKSLKYRLMLINNALIFFGFLSEGVEAELKWIRNLPFDLREKTEVAAILKKEGLLSDETILKLFPQSLVANPQEEIQKRNKEKIRNLKDNQSAMDALINEPRLSEDEDEEEEA